MKQTSESVRNIFTVSNVNPEVLSYGMAAFSRSPRSLMDSIQTLTSEKASNFLESFYFKYGHKSIADMAHVPMSLENITMLDAIEVEDEQLWDGQERSSRYQDFTVTGYTVPEEIANSEFAERFTRSVDSLFDMYQKVFDKMQWYYKQEAPKPSDMGDQDYERTIRARSFDVARYFLPLCSNTSVAQVVNARTLEGQISRLLASPYPTVRRVGEAIKQANLAPSVTSNGPGEPAAPTLVKYTAPSEYLNRVDDEAERVSDELVELFGLDGMDDWKVQGNHVNLYQTGDPIIAAITNACFAVSGLPYPVIMGLVCSMDRQDISDLFRELYDLRDPHDALHRIFRGGPLTFEVSCDIGAYRDLHRHRRATQIRQRFNVMQSFQIPGDLCHADMDLFVEAQHLLEENKKLAWLVENNVGVGLGVYLLPLATNCRCLFTMDLAEAIYIPELRSKPGGHFSYRDISWQWGQKLLSMYPELEGMLNVQHMNMGDILKR